MHVQTVADLVKEFSEIEKIQLDPGIYNEWKDMFFSKSYASWLETTGKELETAWKITRIMKYLNDCVIPRLSPEAPYINKYSIGYGFLGSCLTVVIMTDNKEHFDRYLGSVKKFFGEQLKLSNTGVETICIVVEGEVSQFFKYIGE